MRDIARSKAFGLWVCSAANAVGRIRFSKAKPCESKLTRYLRYPFVAKCGGKVIIMLFRLPDLDSGYRDKGGRIV